MVGLRYSIIVISLFVIVAGSAETGPTQDAVAATSPSPSPDPTSSSTLAQPPTSKATLSSTATRTPTAASTPTPRGPQHGTEWTVSSTRVIDGDTVEAEFPNGEIDTLRLLGVDTPETTYSNVEPSEYEGIPDTTDGRDHLFNWGKMALTFAESTLDGKTARIEVDPQADRRGSFGRLLVYIYVDGEDINKRLIEE